MSSALIRLRERSAQFSSTERGVAERILAEPRLVVDLSVHELAQKTFSSPSTIVRMCTHTGYSGYKEFRRDVTYELARREQDLRGRKQEIQHSDSLEQIIDKITDANILSLEETRELMDVEVLRSSVEVIRRSRVIYLFGMGASLCAAKDAYLKFLRLNKLCIINEDWHSQLVQSFNATAQDAALVFSYSGATAEVHEEPEAPGHAHDRHHPLHSVAGVGPGGLQALYGCQRIPVPQRRHVLQDVSAERGRHPVHSPGQCRLRPVCGPVVQNSHCQG